MHHQLSINGAFNFRGTTLDCDIDLAYGPDDYMDVRSMAAWSNRRRAYVPVSKLLILKFQNEKWDWLYGQTIQHSNDMAEYFRDMRNEEHWLGKSLSQSRHRWQNIIGR